MKVSVLSYDVAIIQAVTSSHKKSYGQTCNNTLARTRNVIYNVLVNNAFSLSTKAHFEGDEIPF